ncbi:MAG: hypothetical protein KGI79_01980 [Patescibacteria group bacterium]|nr:hypothetical protein [Patescibacteria group bacterium]MDE2116620.1 hypothetical protein [Patescibacteria group bacterium]
MSTAIKKINKLLAAALTGAMALFGLAFATGASAQVATSTSTTTASASATSTVPNIGAPTVVASDPTAGTALVEWSTDIPATTQVYYGLSPGNYGHSSTIDDTLTTAHSALMTGLSPDVTYHFVASSNSDSGVNGASSDQIFTMPAAAMTATSTLTGTVSPVGVVSTGSSTLDSVITQLENQIHALQSEVASLQAQIQSVYNGQTGNVSTSTPANSTATSSAIATITPNGVSVRNGTSVDFSGSGFWNNEPVNVMANGQIVSTARADGGGNFSTGSLPVDGTLGSQTYSFVGQWSGITGSATVRVIP